MSLSHTRRRKRIATLKRHHGWRNWLKVFLAERDEIVKKRQGPLIGTLEDIMNAANQSTP